MDNFDDFYKLGYRLNKNSIEQFDLESLNLLTMNGIFSFC